MAGRAGRVVKKKGSNLLWVTIILSFQGKKKRVLSKLILVWHKATHVGHPVRIKIRIILKLAKFLFTA